MGYMQPQPIPTAVAVATVVTKFFCPKCRKELYRDKNTHKYNDIFCDVCNKGPTKDVVTCVKCNYDLCYSCAA